MYDGETYYSPPSPQADDDGSILPSRPQYYQSDTSQPPATQADDASPNHKSDTSQPSAGLVAGVVVAAAVVLVVVVVVAIYFYLKKKRYIPPLPPKANASVSGKVPQPSPRLPDVEGGAVPMPRSPIINSSSGESGSNQFGSETSSASPSILVGYSQSRHFRYEELEIATDGFSEANLLGQGGFGYVHKGVLSNGKEVAVKQLKAGSTQGEREFQAEIEIISRVHHRHLVSLVGFCITGNKRLLVYEFVPNKTLEFHLHEKGRPIMDWPTRLKIAFGSAKGLAYLHEDCNPKIIHRDIKGANILLDLNFIAKVADFGLAKITSDLDTHVSTRVLGSFGYLAPEYASSGKLTEKSDVYSFGIVLLELITGRRPPEGLLDWARPLLLRALKDGSFDGLVDPKLQDNYDHKQMTCMVTCATACVNYWAKHRPQMSQVVQVLGGDASLSNINEGIQPGLSTVYGSPGNFHSDMSKYNENLNKFKMMALENGDNDQTSGEMETTMMTKNANGDFSASS